ncbi:MAG: hypothetical protein EVA87_06815 [Rhodospirillaceae bacterium]|nr:hypothetical protein [Rhodospirillaceae bacterium]RPF99740.1 MAG: hypothetical protein CBC23_006880 [Rhodospirillaceae bacterium TMED63]RZO37709.1 MAG: hypothetical protein EVA87_06815 [Rhodospirillaceae bacterium]
MSTPLIRPAAIIALAVGLVLSPHAIAQGVTGSAAIMKEIKALKDAYEKKTAELEAKIRALEAQKSQQTAKNKAPAGRRIIKDNSFNPSIGLVLNGKASSFTRKTAGDIAGFAIGEEGERGNEGLSIDESELNFSANIDDKFYGSLTAAIVREEGEDKIELEEAYVQTLPNAGLPDGARLKFGRAFWTFGYLNEQHAHADDFADRPLPYRAYLNKAFNDDGVELSYVLPTEQYFEIGGGAFRGDDFPSGNSVTGLGGSSIFARTGGDLGNNQSWRFGAYAMYSDANARATEEGAVTFSGNSYLYAADVRYTYAPTGNAKAQELILQAEIFQRDENGTYNVGGGPVALDDTSVGYYAQAVYKFSPSIRAGVRFSQLDAVDTPAGLIGTDLDSRGHDPRTFSVMADWTNSEFGRIRLQYNHEDLNDVATDKQVILQYVMSLGAHGAHPF